MFSVKDHVAKKSKNFGNSSKKQVVLNLHNDGLNKCVMCRLLHQMARSMDDFHPENLPPENLPAENFPTILFIIRL